METVRYIDVTKAQLPIGTINRNIGSNICPWFPCSKLWVLMIQVKMAQMMKMMSTTARLMRSLWNVSLNSFLLKIVMLTMFPINNCFKCLLLMYCRSASFCSMLSIHKSLLIHKIEYLQFLKIQQ